MDSINTDNLLQTLDNNQEDTKPPQHANEDECLQEEWTSALEQMKSRNDKQEDIATPEMNYEEEYACEEWTSIKEIYWQMIHCPICQNAITISHHLARRGKPEAQTEESFKFSQKQANGGSGLCITMVPLDNAKLVLREGGYHCIDGDIQFDPDGLLLVWEEGLTTVKCMGCERFWVECFLQMYGRSDEDRVLEGVIKTNEYW